ncbi:MAG: hypothetical protein ABJZ55_25375 [Fuerstiella sp.]
MKLILRFIVVCLVIWPISNPSVLNAASEHPISITEAQAFVTASRVRMRIQLFAEDLFLFQGLEPNDQDIIDADQLQRGLDQHRNFLLDKVQILDASGKALPSDVTDLQPFDIPEEGIAVAELMLFSATYQLEFTYDDPPEFLTFQQNISDESFIFPSEMKITIHQAGTDLTVRDSLKPGNSKTVRFDWTDSQPGDDSSDAEWDAWFEKQREATLGITSYSSVYSFIYVEPAEVRHEVLIPLATLKEILPLKHADPAFITVEEQAGVRELIENWLGSQNPTMINRRMVPPEFTRVDFYGLDLKDFARQAEAREVSLANGRAGIIMTYRPKSDDIQSVTLAWDAFSAALRKVEAVAFTGEKGLQKFEFSRFKKPEENEFKWKANPALTRAPIENVAAVYPAKPQVAFSPASLVLLLVAAISWFVVPKKARFLSFLLMVAALAVWPVQQMQFDSPFEDVETVSASTADTAFQQLHAGMYRALDFGTEGRIYEVLETNVDGQLLEDLYLQLRESLRMKEQGGAVARVQSIERLEGDLVPAADASAQEVEWPGFQYRSTWTVSGTVEHWGHIHERNNKFSALFTIQEDNGDWKITGLQMEDQESLAAKTRLRKF